MMRGRRAAVTALAAAALSGGAAAAGAQAPPAGWRRPPMAALAGPDLALRQSAPDLNLKVSADFDGDGDADSAELLLARDGRTFALFASLASPAGAVQVKLAEGPAEDLPRTGVSLAPPGVYATACGKGAGRACDAARLELKLPAISLFTYESGAVYFDWDGGAFARTWAAD